jgi:hypothetical protein
MIGMWGAILQFAIERFSILANNIAAELQKHDASGIYGDDAGKEYDFPIETLWDEYCYEKFQGPTYGLERAWEETVRPFVEAAVDTLSERERQLLSIVTDYNVELGEDAEDFPVIDRDGLCKEVLDALRELAARRL